MAELKSPSENTCSARLSQEVNQMPLSPVLGSGQSLKKLLKTRKQRQKRESNKVAQKLENVMMPKEDTDKNSNSVKQENNELLLDDSMLQDFEKLEDSTLNIDIVPGSGKHTKLSAYIYNPQDMPENLLERIQFLEELESKKNKVIKTLSFSKSVEMMTLEESVSSNTKHPLNQADIKIIKESSIYPEPTVNINPSTLQKDINKMVHFQTCTGKGINIGDADIRRSAKLFDDILRPSNNQSVREKKFNYLSKYQSPETYASLQTESCALPDKPEFTRNYKPISNIVADLNCYKNSKADLTSTVTSKSFNAEENKKLRNIFEGENFDNLKMFQNSGFKAVSVILRKEPVNNEIVSQLREEEHQQERCQIVSKEKSYDNKKIPPKDGSKATSISSQNDTSQQKSKAAILPKEVQKEPIENSFNADSLDNFKLTLNTGCKTTALCLENEEFITNSWELKKDPSEKPAEKTFKESFRALNVPNNSGFQPACFRLKDGENLHNVGALSNSTKTLSTNIFEGENFCNIKFTENVGFKPASVSNVNSIGTPAKTDVCNKQVNTTRNLKRTLLSKTYNEEPPAKKPFINIFEGENFDDLNINFKGFQTLKSGACNNPNKPMTPTITKLHKKPERFRNIFENENFDDLSLNALGPKVQSPVPKSKSNHLQKQIFESPYRTPIKNHIQPNTDDGSDNNFHGFNQEEKQTAVNISEGKCDIVNIIEKRFKEIISQQNSDAPMINLSNINSLSKKLHNNMLKFSIESSLLKNNGHLEKKRKFSKLDSDHNIRCRGPNPLPDQNINTSSSNTPLQNSFLKRPKRLGCHFSPTIQISETVLKRAKFMFQDLEREPLETSTPNRFDKSLAVPLTCELTPIQGVRKNLGVSFMDATKHNNLSRSFNKSVTLDQTLVRNNARFGLSKPSEGDVRVWMEKLGCERRRLGEMLKVVDEKQTILANQRTILEFSAKGKHRILPGVLYNSKSMKGRISLRELFNTAQSEKTSVSHFLNQVNPQNAHLVHIYMENRQSHIQTQDGAVLVPTNECRIGISEIEHSFKVMEGVDPNLLPKGWIQNHYKWIIWKLASYERQFPENFGGSLCVENIVQQLKYRYDIEIDKVKRSALHKIFEKDDCSQRRLVLCVSRIMKQVANTYELELTDGWYPIRTVIDPLLCDQILKGKIKLGVKLMTYGAELVNCEGCHPLEAIDQMYLKINYNSTRRAAFWAKLGCQKDSGPFLIPLASVNMEGGKIGCMKCFILRSYPVKYMEKFGDRTVWRNRKAEERREQDFNNEKINTLERTTNLYNEPDQNNLYLKESNRDILKSIRNIDDPEVLYEIVQRSTDPEYVQESLSSSQKTILYNYTMEKSAQNQSRLVNNFNEKAKMLQDRAVTSLLKIKIMDASCESNAVYDFHVWRPQESHIQELREGEVVTVFNVSCSSKWGLTANSTTIFKKEQKPQDVRYQRFKRRATPMEEFQYFSRENEILHEFDTVGIIIKKKVGDHQQIWLSDSKENLLIIKIYDSPKNILLLDAVNEGQIVTVCNLLFKYSSAAYTFAVADHFVIFSRYSQYRHLQEATERLEQELENKDLTAFLQLCRNKVDKIESKWDCRNPNLAWDVDDMDCSQITTTDLALLKCLDTLT